jgi:hypothetical protein
MKIVKVIYTAKTEYTDQNVTNIKAVMNVLKGVRYSGIFYHVCLSADGKTFTHTAFFKSDEDQKLLNELDSFRIFQERLKSGGLEIPPKQELMTLVGASNNIFNP